MDKKYLPVLIIASLAITSTSLFAQAATTTTSTTVTNTQSTPASPAPANAAAPLTMPNREVPGMTKNYDTCREVATGIAAVSQMKSSKQTYPWEDVNWLTQKLGPAREIQSGINKSYMWRCVGKDNFYFIIIMDINLMGQQQLLHQSLVCDKTSGCTLYSFKRVGTEIKGYSMQTMPPGQ